MKTRPQQRGEEAHHAAGRRVKAEDLALHVRGVTRASRERLDACAGPTDARG